MQNQGDVTIRDLKCAIVVAQEGSLSRAAARLHMIQPALGRRVHHVEAEVGVRLFYPWYGGLRLIYRVVVVDTKIWAPRTGIPHRCLVSSNVQGYFEELIDDAQETILSMLVQRTLLQALTELEIRESVKKTTSKVRLPTLMCNHDERIAVDHKTIPLAKHGPDERVARVHAIEDTRLAILPENKAYLSCLPREMWISHGTRNDAKRILLVHGSPRSTDEYIYEDHPEKDLTSMLRKRGEDAVVMGHTHLPYIRKVAGHKLVLNVGSVGRSKETPLSATYLVLTIIGSRIRSQIVRVRYPVEKTITGILESTIPDFYANFLAKKATASS